MRTRGFIALLGLSALAIPAFTSAQVVDVSDCRAIDDLEKRLACYDRLAGASDAPAAEAERSRTVEAPRSAADTPRGGASRAAEVSRPAAPPAAEASSKSAAAALADGDRNSGALTGKIASLERYGPQMWLIALESGQQWRQTIGKPYRLHVGDEVRVYPTRWGDAYRLSSERIGGYIQVVRAD